MSISLLLSTIAVGTFIGVYFGVAFWVVKQSLADLRSYDEGVGDLSKR